ncbi:MAG TPA: hypothetical protein VGM01_15370 [Ktedonobacteraceae bacterium]
MQNNLYRVVVIPDLNKGRPISRQTAAQNATAAAGVVLSSLRLGQVDLVEVSVVRAGHHSTGKVAFYSCLYGAVHGFSYVDRIAVAS